MLQLFIFNALLRVPSFTMCSNLGNPNLGNPELVHLVRYDIELNLTGISRDRIIASNFYNGRLHFTQRYFEKNEPLFAIKSFLIYFTFSFQYTV